MTKNLHRWLRSEPGRSAVSRLSHLFAPVVGVLQAVLLLPLPQRQRVLFPMKTL
jgi:hypothetical protein